MQIGYINNVTRLSNRYLHKSISRNLSKLFFNDHQKFESRDIVLSRVESIHIRGWIPEQVKADLIYTVDLLLNEKIM